MRKVGRRARAPRERAAAASSPPPAATRLPATAAAAPPPPGLLAARLLRARRLGHDVTGAHRVQRYFELKTPTVVGSGNFRSQEADAELDEPGARLTRTRTTLDSAPLLVAEDRTLAVHKTEDEPKEFFALAKTVKASNQQLQSVESPVRLQAQTAKTVDVGGLAPLVRVVPRLADDPKSYPGPPPLLAHRCIELASHVMGNKGGSNLELVLKSATKGRKGRQAVTPIAPDMKGAPQIDRLAALLSKSSSSYSRVKDVHEKLPGILQDKKNEPVYPGKGYGAKQGRGQLAAREKDLGVNEWALPGVGEGWATFTVAAEQTGTKDYSVLGQQSQPLVRPSTWGYHFAAVVAKSGDGADRVALENYNRSPRIDDITGKAWKTMQQKAAVDKRFKLNEEWNTFYKKVVASEDPTTLWFFRLYGTQKGQTFHEQQAKSGGFVNPLTVRVRRHPPDVVKDKLRRVGARTEGLLTGFVAPDDGVTSAVGKLAPTWKSEVQKLVDRVDREPQLLSRNDQVPKYLKWLDGRLREIEAKRLVPELAKALRGVERRKSKRVAKDRQGLAAEIEEQQRPGFWDVAGDFFDHLHQGIPDYELDRRATVDALADLVDALPDAYF